MASHIKAACDARHDQDFVVIARTDAIAVEGFNAGLERAHAYREAGADVLFIEAMTSEEQLAEACPSIPRYPPALQHGKQRQDPVPVC